MLENFKLLVIISLIFLLIGISFNKRDNRIANLELLLVEANTKITETNEENKKLHSYLKELEDELESIDDIYRTENTLMWHSIGIMRNNFLALGLGFHLEEEDICPDEVVDCEEENP